MERKPEFPKFEDHERRFGGEYESSPEKERSPEEELLEAFEKGRRFDEEDEKARDYNARLDAADEYQKQVDEISEQISQATGMLATLPLTYDQQVLLDKIERLMAERRASRDMQRQAELDDQIEATTKQLAALPVTSEQGTLLDQILELMDAREATEVKLRTIFN